jgi:4-carboxymuconolactone decarboxylase
MATSEAYERGRDTRRAVMGEETVQQMAATAYDHDVMTAFVDYATEAVWGLLWSRPGLDLKTRTLVSVVTTATQGRWPELAMYLPMARAQGWSEDELVEALMQLAGYVGLPTTREALLIATETFAAAPKSS